MDSDQHWGLVSSTEFVPQISIDSYPHIIIRDPNAPVKTKRHPKVATRIRSGIETSVKCKEQGHIYNSCTKGGWSEGSNGPRMLLVNTYKNKYRDKSVLTREWTDLMACMFDEIEGVSSTSLR